MKWRKLFQKTFLSPFLEFIHDSRAIGIILLVCTFFSLLMANSGASAAYLQWWNTSISHNNYLPHSVLHWINDGLMAIFFFLVGMEIKREMISGELSSLKKSLLPVLAAFGGMVVPALIFIFFNGKTNYSHGWGIPMATDIAFSLGVASLLGKRVPLGLKVFLTALAIIDDLGAIITIAIFYSTALQWYYLLAAALLLIILLLLNKFKIKFGWWNYLLGLALWFCIFNSGIHATIAGVLFAFTIPLNKLPSLEHKFHDAVNFLILPLFALANTAIIFPADISAAVSSSLSLGIIAGLLLGKPLGITLICFLAVKLNIAQLPSKTNWQKLLGVGILAGIGFTMSIFISMLAFDNAAWQDISKIAVLAASLLAMLIGFLWLRFFTKL
ncbi:MAG: Na+/H+ antiporter NhaA [Sphingobacteriales bacterium]|nr:MAG: Na+/H+ antiporter NhaA [Sphingobacteriales bacterium]